MQRVPFRSLHVWYNITCMNPNPNNPCTACHITRASSQPFVSFKDFIVTAKPELGAVPGWMLIIPKQHIEHIDALSEEQSVEMALIISKTSKALRTATACEKIYVCVFAEVLHHLHVHVIARPNDLPIHLRGPAIFNAPSLCNKEEAKRTTHRVLDLLRSTTATR
jgi:diadenosine tetraphosphate (Ap4A) HIT family hydrolase